MKKVAIITGSSRGIGAATAKLLAKNNYAVCVNYLTKHDKAEEIVSAIRSEGGEALAIQADISNEKEVIKLFNETEKNLGLVSALVNNAGINGDFCGVEDLTFDCLQSVFSTNVYGTFLCCREAVKHMKKLGNGGIVNVSSEAAKFGGNKIAHYAASKAAISALTLGFAREVTPFNIRVNAVSPGVIDTDLHAQASSERIQALKNSLPMGRMGTPDEVAQSIYWLLSEKSSYLSGSVITIAGGR